MKTKILLTAIVIACTAQSCEQQPVSETVPLKNAPSAQAESRFKVARFGQFDAGYNDNAREILIITDSKTGREYLGITGVGVTELYETRQNKYTVTKEE